MFIDYPVTKYVDPYSDDAFYDISRYALDIALEEKDIPFEKKLANAKQVRNYLLGFETEEKKECLNDTELAMLKKMEKGIKSAIEKVEKDK